MAPQLVQSIDTLSYCIVLFAFDCFYRE